MRRREFITLLGSGAAVWPMVAMGQQTTQLRRIGALIGGGAPSDPVVQGYVAAFRSGLAKLGWVEGRNLHIELRFADGGRDAIHASAAELVGLAPEVIFTSTGIATAEVQGQTSTIPIVFAGPSDVSQGVQNIAHPEGNITGFPILYSSIAGKWLELLKEAAPRLSQTAVLFGALGASATGRSSYLPWIEMAATALAVKVIPAQFRENSNDIERAIASAAVQADAGVIVLPGTFTANRPNRELISRLASKYRVPVIHWDRLYPAEGGLMSYGSNFTDLHRRAASYVDRILLGAKIRELPVQVPTQFELAINRKAADTIGLRISETLLARADEVIE